jgi:hypothetical protein
MSEVKADTRLAKVVYVADAGIAPGPVEIVINRGILEGVKPGDRFLVFGIGPHIFDPDTGKDLGELEVVRGQGEVVHVQEHLATIRTLQRRRVRPGKRIIRETARHWTTFDAPSSVTEEELAPETEVPFESVQLGDLAKPI